MRLDLWAIASTIYLLKAIAIAVSRDFWTIADQLYILLYCDAIAV
ncbi:hypothetical protein [Phormidium tenue]|nr:hypothetical protein [Phormidium tenue]